MRTGGRLAAAIEILTTIETQHRPASQALQDWGRAHRFAGSGDRAAIGNLVFDVLRKKLSLAHHMQSVTPRALVLGVVTQGWGMDIAALTTALEDPHAPDPLTDDEITRIQAPVSDTAAAHVAGDYPAWLEASFERVYGEGAAEEGAGLATRAPVDLRVNLLKTSRDKLLASLSRFEPEPTAYSPDGIRIAPPKGGKKSPNIEVEAAHGKGWFEVQDEGSQIAARLAGAAPGMQVLDLCAGAGGKTLALAAITENKGQIHAYDSNRQRLRPIWERLKRAGVRNVQVMEAGDQTALDQLAGKMDVVLVDAPCTGSGTWRRRPDAKWRLTPDALTKRMGEQDEVLALGGPCVKPGGRMIYVTCSVLPEENEDRIKAFTDANPDWDIIPAYESWQENISSDPPVGIGRFARLTPRTHGTDGFFVAILKRRTT